MKRLFTLGLAAAFSLPAAVFDITTFGAKGDGKTQNRAAINKAIEAASAAGGGTVEVPAGVWVTGSLRLRSNVTLRLEPGSVIEASRPLPDQSFGTPKIPNRNTSSIPTMTINFQLRFLFMKNQSPVFGR